MKTILLICIALALLTLTSSVRAQNIYAGNPADPALLESAFSNPALNAYVRDRFALAMTAHHVGIAGNFFSVRSGIISYHLPWQLRGSAAAIQFLQAGLYSRSDIRLSYGRRVAGPLSLGGNLDIFTWSYDRSKFFMFDDRDPVFRDGTSRTSASFGFGATLEPYRGLIIGLAIQHFNQPDMALGPQSFAHPLALSFGLKWHMQGFNATSAVNSLPLAHYSWHSTGVALDRMGKYTGLGAEVPIGRAALRAASDASAVQLEAEAPLYGSLYVNYRYAYPLTDVSVASDGTHRFGFLFDFDRLPPLPSMPSLPDMPPIRSGIEPLGAAPRALYYVYANADSVNVRRLHVHRNIEPGISKQSLAIMFPEDLGSLRAAQKPTPLRELNLLQVRDPQVRPRGFYSARYRGALEDIGQQLRAGDSQIRPEVISFPGNEKRANALVNTLTGDHLAVKEPVPIYTTSAPPMSPDSVEKVIAESEDSQRLVTPEHAVFHLVPIFQQRPIGRWSLELRNARETSVYTFSGIGTPPDSVVWNWQDAQGNVVTPGIYYYILKSVDDMGQVTYSDRGRFDVIHQFQSLSIDVTRKSRVGEIPADKYILIVGSEHAPFEPQHTDTTIHRLQ